MSSMTVHLGYNPISNCTNRYLLTMPVLCLLLLIQRRPQIPVVMASATILVVSVGILVVIWLQTTQQLLSSRTWLQGRRTSTISKRRCKVQDSAAAWVFMVQRISPSAPILVEISTRHQMILRSGYYMLWSIGCGIYGRLRTCRTDYRSLREGRACLAVEGHRSWVMFRTWVSSHRRPIPLARLWVRLMARSVMCMNRVIRSLVYDIWAVEQSPCNCDSTISHQCIRVLVLLQSTGLALRIRNEAS